MLSRLAPLTVYMLKRQFGEQIDIYKLLGSETDVRTGAKVVTTTTYRVKRAIVFPAGYSRTRMPPVTSVTGFVASGSRDLSVRDFLVDRKDAKGLTSLTSDDWIVYKGKKYQVKSLEACEIDSAWLITAKELVGEVPQQVISVKADDGLRVDNVV